MHCLRCLQVHRQLLLMWDNEVVHTVGMPALRSAEYPGDASDATAGGPGYAHVHIRMDNNVLQACHAVHRTPNPSLQSL